MEESLTGSVSWVTDPSGTIRHLPTGAKFSEKNGISVEGTSYTLTPADIELETDSKSGRLGAGACGVVQKGRIISTGQMVAIKGIKIDAKEMKEQLLNEIKSLVTAEWCPFLVTWYGGFITKSIVHVVLELMDLGSLKGLSKKCPAGVPAEHMARVSSSSLQGLLFLHDKHIAHRDIKPDNILYNSIGEVKLTDFGISRSLDATIAMAGTQIGTQIYMAPEMCLGQDYNFSVDIWGLGLVIYELATGRFPFDGASTSFAAIFQAIVEDPEPRLDGSYPPELCDLVAKCLTREVRDRADTPSLVRHPFVATPETNEEFAAFLSTLT